METVPLVDSQIADGARIVGALDNAGVRLDAALWLYTSDTGSWRLLLATPLVDTAGPARTYQRVQSALARMDLDHLLSSVSAVSPRSPFIRALRRAFRTGPGIASIRLTASTIDGTYVDDAHLYRVR